MQRAGEAGRLPKTVARAIAVVITVMLVFGATAQRSELGLGAGPADATAVIARRGRADACPTAD